MSVTAGLRCTQCYNDNLVWVHADGDIVCPNCGLVVSRIFDDSITYDNSGWVYQVNHEEQINSTVAKYVSELGISREKLEGINAACAGASAAREKIQKADVAAGIYNTTHGVSGKSICAALNMKPRKFWKSAAGMSKCENMAQTILKRTIFECAYIPSESAWQVYKVANKILGSIQDQGTQTLKPDRLAISLMIVSCEINKVCNAGLKRTRICKEYGISPDTVKKHEALIQALLVKGGAL